MIRKKKVQTWVVVVGGLIERDVRMVFRGIPDIRSYRRPMTLARRGGRERWSWRAPRLNAVREHQDLRLLIGVTGARARMAFNHPLGREERLDFFTQDGDAFGLLDSEIRVCRRKRVAREMN